jgi:hypothetical protein
MERMSAGLVGRKVRVVASWTAEERDAVLYAASALFAAGTAQFSSIPLYQQWGRLAAGPYAAGSVLSALLARRQRRRAAPTVLGEGVEGPPGDTGDGAGWHWTTPRAVVFLVVLLGATLVPLSLEVLWRTDANGTTHVQPEVAVVERAGTAEAHLHNPYSRINPHAAVRVPPGEPAYDAYNPYLPLMGLFGGPRSTHAPARLTDARVAFSVFTIVVVVIALALCRGPTGPRVLTLQAMTVLPTAALPLATGGDDLPVAALMLLGLVLLQRRRPFAAGAVLGVAASMKVTAWPLAALALLAARDRDGRGGRRPARSVLLGLVAVSVPAILPTAAANLPAFVDDVVRFPLGLAGVQSPAASPLIGHVVVSIFPSVHRVFTASVAAGGAVALAYVLVRHTPTTPAALARLVGWVMTVAILLAPATRVGYLLYPVDFFVWAWLLRGEESVDPVAADALSSASSDARSSGGGRVADGDRHRGDDTDRGGGDPGGSRGNDNGAPERVTVGVGAPPGPQV